MGDIAFRLMNITIKLGFFVVAITAFTTLLNFAILLLGGGLDQTVVGDLAGLIQMWLPFNLNAIFWWFTTMLNAYIVYRIAVYAYQWVNSLLSSV